MKRVVSNKELREKMLDAINLLCDTVKCTLGPKGNNVIIDHSSFSPFITNDGVTIASNIESEDPIINTILELAKEASQKTNELVGDGTTTTLVLLQSIFSNGLKLIENGKNPIVLKKDLDEYLNVILKLIKEKSRKVKTKELYKIASISANSKEIGKLITDAYLKVKTKDAIIIKEWSNSYDEANLKKGYIIDTLIASPYFFQDQNNISLNNSFVLIINNYINELEDISNIVNYIIKTKSKLVIFAEDYSELFVNQILSLLLNEDINIILLKFPEYGKNKLDIINDISLITNSKIIEDLSYINETILGKVSSININKDETILEFVSNDKTKDKINQLNKLLKANVDLDFVNKRISMLQNGIIEINVGANTETERREKKMRYDDALCALESSKEGIVSGCGLTFYEISEKLPLLNGCHDIIKNTLKEPFKQIMLNSGLDENIIISKIRNSNFAYIYNVNKNDFELISETEVFDPAKVLENSLLSAFSIASMLLTTSSLIINEYKNNINKINDYSEL